MTGKLKRGCQECVAARQSARLSEPLSSDLPPGDPPGLTATVLQDTPPGAEVLLRTEGLVKQYRGRRVVNGVSISVASGEIVGLLGPNGAGKTTTFNMVVGVVTPDAGRVKFQDRDITALAMHQRARLGIGYLTQEPSVFRK